MSQSSEASITQRHGAKLLPPAPISRRPALKIKGAPSGGAPLPRVPRRGYLLRPITHQGNLGKGKAVNGWSGSSRAALGSWRLLLLRAAALDGCLLLPLCGSRPCSISDGCSHLPRRLSGPALERMRECAHLMKTEQPRDLGDMQLAVVEVTNCQIAPQLLKCFREVQSFVRKPSCKRPLAHSQTAGNVFHKHFSMRKQRRDRVLNSRAQLVHITSSIG